MKHFSNTIFVFILSITSVISAMTPEIKQAIAMWEEGKEVEAVPILLKYKDSDDADALAYLGRSYINGRGIEKNLSLAFKCFSKAAEQGQPYGLNGLGICYRNGLGVKQDLQKAENYFKQAAKAKCPLAEFNLGMLYQGGLTVDEGTPSIPDLGNVKKALEHFRASYDAGNLKVLCAERIGILMLNSETPGDAVKWIREAADGDRPLALETLAKLYENGELVAINRNYAIDYADRLGKLLNDYSLYSDICYRTGMEYIFLRQRREALLFFQMAADAGHADAQFQMAQGHPDAVLRGKYALMAVKNGNRQMLVKAGTYLANQKQYGEAMKLYQEAVKDGNLEAMCEIAIMHRIGEGVPVDYEKSMEWYAKAAEQYYPRALRELGVKYLLKYDEDSKKEFYANIPPDLSRAYAFMTMAIFLNGDEAAQQKLPSFPFYNEIRKIVPADSDMELAKGLIFICYGDGKSDLEEGIKLLEASVSHGNVDAMNMLGYLFFIEGPCKDLKKSAHYYKMAVAKGNDYAAMQLCDNNFEDILGEKGYQEYLDAQAAKGYGGALYNLANFYEKKGDYEKAGKLHLKNARNGDDYSILKLHIYQLSKRQLPCEVKEIDSLLFQAAARHFGDAEFFQAAYYRDMKDWRNAAVFLMRAYCSGCIVNVASMYIDLGYAFLLGQGVQRNPDVAVDIFENGIKSGNWDICLILGSLFATGSDGVQKDTAYAVELFKLGVEHKVKGCQEELGKLQTKDSKKQE